MSVWAPTRGGLSGGPTAGALDRTIPLGTLIPPLAVTALLYAGSLKATPVLQSLPLDLTLVGAVFLTAVVASELWARRLTLPFQTLIFVALWVVFLGGAWQGSEDQYASDKILTLYTITLLAVVGAFLVLSSPARRTVWLYSLAGIGTVLVLIALAFPSQRALQAGLLAADGSNTIAAGQAAGIAIVVVAVAGATRMLPRTVAAAWVLLLVGPLIATGSKGPVLSVIIALAAVVVLRPARTAVRVRRLAVAGVTAAAAGAVILTAEGESAGLTRIADLFVQGDPAREYLYTNSLPMIVDHPLGVGWGNFANYLPGLVTLETSQAQIKYPHNLFLETFFEAGWLPGLLLTAFVLVSLARLVRRSAQPTEAAILAVAVFFLVAALFSEDINGNRALLVALALAWVPRTDHDLHPAPPPSGGDPPRGRRPRSRGPVRARRSPRLVGAERGR